MTSRAHQTVYWPGIDTGIKTQNTPISIAMNTLLAFQKNH